MKYLTEIQITALANEFVSSLEFSKNTDRRSRNLNNNYATALNLFCAGLINNEQFIRLEAINRTSFDSLPPIHISI